MVWFTSERRMPGNMGRGIPGKRSHKSNILLSSLCLIYLLILPPALWNQIGYIMRLGAFLQAGSFAKNNFKWDVFANFQSHVCPIQHKQNPNALCYNKHRADQNKPITCFWWRFDTSGAVFFLSFAALQICRVKLVSHKYGKMKSLQSVFKFCDLKRASRHPYPSSIIQHTVPDVLKMYFRIT